MIIAGGSDTLIYTFPWEPNKSVTSRLYFISTKPSLTRTFYFVSWLDAAPIAKPVTGIFMFFDFLTVCYLHVTLFTPVFRSVKFRTKWTKIFWITTWGKNYGKYRKLLKTRENVPGKLRNIFFRNFYTKNILQNWKKIIKSVSKIDNLPFWLPCSSQDVQMIWSPDFPSISKVPFL